MKNYMRTKIFDFSYQQNSRIINNLNQMHKLLIKLYISSDDTYNHISYTSLIIFKMWIIYVESLTSIVFHVNTEQDKITIASFLFPPYNTQSEISPRNGWQHHADTWNYLLELGLEGNPTLSLFTLYNWLKQGV